MRKVISISGHFAAPTRTGRMATDHSEAGHAAGTNIVSARGSGVSGRPAATAASVRF